MNHLSSEKNKSPFCPFVNALAVLLLATISCSNESSAQTTYHWVGSGQSLEYYHFPNNWLLNSVPGSTDIAQFNISVSTPTTVRFEHDAVVDELLLFGSDYSFQSYSILDNGPRTYTADRVAIGGDAKLSLAIGLNEQTFLFSSNESHVAGELRVSEGAKVISSTTYASAQESGDPAILRIVGEYNGISSTLEANELLIGPSEKGTLVIKDGGFVEAQSTTYIGLDTAGDGKLLIEGNNTSVHPSILVTDRLYVGPSSSILMTGRSEITSSRLITRSDTGHPVLINVSQPGSRIQIDGEFFHNGGRFHLENGATFSTDDAHISVSNGMEGLVEMSSTDSAALSKWVNSGDLFLAGDRVGPDLNGGGILIDGGIVEVGGTMKLWDAASLTMSTSNGVPTMLIANEIENILGGQFNLDGGTLSVDWFVGNLYNVGGTLAIGDDVSGNLPGRSVVLGDYIQGPDSTLMIDVGGEDHFDDYDVFEVGGFMAVEGDLEVFMQNGFLPNGDDEFVVVSASNIVGDFDNVENGERLNTMDGSGSFQVNYGFASLFRPDQIVLSDFQLSGFVVGDLNGDGVVNLLDVGPLVDVIGSGDFVPAADINQDGAVDLLDVGPFVELLVG